jgi:branched-chain amino acid transport system permease protein
MNKKLLLATVIALAILPIFVHHRTYIMHIMILCFIWGVVASAWNLIMGYASIFSFSQIAFFTISGYTTGMMSKYWGVSPWLGIVPGAILASIAGVLIGLPCLRLKGIFIAVATLALHLSLPTLLSQGRAYGTGGSHGLAGIPPFQVGERVFGHLSWYYLLLIVFLILLFVIYKVIHSRMGLAFVALRDAGHFAESLGVNDYKYKLIIFAVSAFITGIMGGLLTHYTGAISPAMLGTDLFLVVIAMVLFGGLGRFPGAVIGAFAITFANELLRPTGTFRLLILGGIIVVTMIYMPKGLMGMLESVGRFLSVRSAKSGG